jgi:hypothetical protein
MVDGKYRAFMSRAGFEPVTSTFCTGSKTAQTIRWNGHRDGQQHIQYGGCYEHYSLEMDAEKVFDSRQHWYTSQTMITATVFGWRRNGRLGKIE